MADKKNVYPDWAEKFRGKGKTIRKVKDGYALYECTSEYVKGSYPKSKQTYLGKITEKDGFIPKKTGAGSTAPHYLEYALSKLITLNFKRKVMRHVFQCTDDLFRLGTIAFVFGSTADVYIRSSYLTYAEADRFCELSGKINSKKISRVSEVIGEVFRESVPDENDMQEIVNLLLLCVVEEGPRSVRKPEIPAEVKDLLDRYNLKCPE